MSAPSRSNVSAAQKDRINRILASEADGEVADDERAAAAAARVFDRFMAQLGPLLSTAGVQALFLRAAKLAKSEFACFEDLTLLHSSASLRDGLRVLEPAVASAASVALFGSFLSLVTTFIGERLTAEALRTSWPALEETASKENE